jgi:hypothetical protein
MKSERSKVFGLWERIFRLPERAEQSSALVARPGRQAGGGRHEDTRG